MALSGSSKGNPGSGKKVANSLVAVSAAAVLAVYAAGYEKTQAAAEKLDAQSAERRPSRGENPVVPSESPAALVASDAAAGAGNDKQDAPRQIASLERTQAPAAIANTSASSASAPSKPGPES